MAKYNYKHFPKADRKSFKLGKDCETLLSELCISMSDAKKEYRDQICFDMRITARQLLHTVRQANNFQVGDPRRREKQNDVIELLMQIDDLLPVLRKCRCISLGQEAELTKRIGNLKISIDLWIESDDKRLASK